MPYNNPLAEFVVALIRWPFQVLYDLWRLLRFLMRPLGMWPGQQPLGPYEKNRRHTVSAVFVLVLCLYILRTGAWLFEQLPPWMPVALTGAAGVSLLFLLAGLYGTRNGPRDLSGAIASLTIAAGCAAALWWQWYVPDVPAGYGPVADDVNWVLPGVYIAVLIAAGVRVLICIRFVGGAERIIARAIRQRSMSRRPALAGSFWEQTRAAFEDGRSGRRWP